RDADRGDRGERQAHPRRGLALVRWQGSSVVRGPAEDRVRDPFRQARGRSLPARHTIPALPSGQGAEGLHLGPARHEAPQRRSGPHGPPYLNVIRSVVLSVTKPFASGLLSALVKPG